MSPVGRRIPWSLYAVGAGALLCQLLLASSRPAPATTDRLAPPPPLPLLRVLSLGDPIPMARLLMLRLQAASARTDFGDMDYAHLAAWLRTLHTLDPGSRYPLFTARVHAETLDERRRRVMLDFLHDSFRQNPGEHWPWLVHAIYLAHHRLRDRDLALHYARDLNAHAGRIDLPVWTRRLEVLVLEDLGELEQARILLGALLDAGQVQGRAELELVRLHLRRLEAAGQRR